MPQFQTVASKSDIAQGSMKEYNIKGKSITIANWQGEYLAFDGICTHAYCSLAGGFLDAYTVTCYCHGSMFDVKKGEVLSPPATVPVKVYPVKVSGDDILVEI